MSDNTKRLFSSATRFQFVLVRLAYANTLIVPKPFRAGQPEKFGCTILMPPGHPGIELTEVALEAAATAEWGPKAKWPKRLRGIHFDPVVKSCADYPAIGDLPPGWCFARCSSTDAPGIVDPEVKVIANQNLRHECCSGRWANVSVNAYAYTFEEMTRGVNLGLGNVQLLKHDERLGAERPSASEEFDPQELPAADNDLDDDDDDVKPVRQPSRRR